MSWDFQQIKQTLREDAAAVASDPKFKKYLAAAVKCVTGSTDFSIPDDISIPDTGN